MQSFPAGQQKIYSINKCKCKQLQMSTNIIMVSTIFRLQKQAPNKKGLTNLQASHLLTTYKIHQSLLTGLVLLGSLKLLHLGMIQYIQFNQPEARLPTRYALWLDDNQTENDTTQPFTPKVQVTEHEHNILIIYERERE